MPKYKPGDVVWCKFPLEEDPTQSIDRPGLVLFALELHNQTIYTIAKITTKDKSHRYPGRWVEKNSVTGRQMRLDDDSFIHLGSIAKVADFGIRKYKGNCPIISEILAICSAKKIKI